MKGAALVLVIGLIGAVGAVPLHGQDADPNPLKFARNTLDGDLTEETVERLDELALQVEGEQRDEITSLRALAQSLVLQERYHTTLRERAVLIDIEEELSASDSSGVVQSVALSGLILGGSTFLTGAAVWFEDPDSNESVLPRTLGGGVAVASGVALVLNPAAGTTVSTTPVVTVQPPASADAEGTAWRASLLGERRDLTAQLAEEVSTLPQLRRRARYAFATGIAGAAAATATFILGQVSFQQYNDATFTEDAVSLRRQVNTYRVLSAASIGASAASLSWWQSLRLRIERPRELLRDIGAIDAALATPAAQ